MPRMPRKLRNVKTLPPSTATIATTRRRGSGRYGLVFTTAVVVALAFFSVQQNHVKLQLYISLGETATINSTSTANNTPTSTGKYNIMNMMILVLVLAVGPAVFSCLSRHATANINCAIVRVRANLRPRTRLHVWPMSTTCSTIVAAVILHIPGLRCRVLYRQNQIDVYRAVLGSITEGVLLLLLYTKAYTVAQQLWREIVAGVHGKALRICDAVILLLLISATLLLLIFSVASSIGDTTFQSITGGAIPDMWALAAGYKDTKSHLHAFQNEGFEAVVKVATFVACFLAAFVVHGLGLRRYKYYLYPRESSRSDPTSPHFNSASNTQAKVDISIGASISNWLLLATMLLALGTYQIGFWQPIMHATLSLFGSYIFTLETVQVQNLKVVHTLNNMGQGKQRPNVLFLMHESTSGAYWLNRKEAIAVTPFFQSLRQNDDNMYVFPYARSVSGDTRDAMTALVTGCLPVTDEAKTMAFGRSIATEFKQQGYQTASFSSRQIGELVGSKWYMLVNYLRGNIDVALDPDSANLPLIEPRFPSTDDRIMAQHFADWSTNRSSTAITNNTNTAADPYFALFYTFNTHWPWVDRGTGVEGVQKYYESFESLDGALKVIFDHLNTTNQLENTIVIGSGDHGEAYEASRSRLGTWNPYVLQPLTYMYVPKQLMTEEKRRTLRSNTERVVSTLDLFQTAQHLAYGGNAHSTADLRNRSNAADATNGFESENCISGVDLLDVSIPTDRVALSFNFVSQSQTTGAMMSAISTLDRGLFVFGPPYRIEWREMMFGNCTATPVQSDEWFSQCIRQVTDADLAYWREVLRGDNTTTLINAAGRNSHFMTALLKAMEKKS